MKKQPNYRKHYSDEDHAIEMFESNSKYLERLNKEPFDILPFSEKYYYDNYECFTHKDKIEISLFITLLINKGYIEKEGNPYNIVKLTDKGLERVSFINRRSEANSMNRI